MSTPGENDATAAIRDAIEATERVERLIDLTVVDTGAGELVVGARIALAADSELRDVVLVIDDVEAAVRVAAPGAVAVYVEPAVVAPVVDLETNTSAIVIMSAD
ncbi:hypothetical protein N1031_15395 [Herbiconiux moechotypicola]|uniref:Uncharacterized protein n=1 Tax=Herbiconiux moechotypicola TaxID=637393 RepID=A0ABN3DZL9_9MICO|nr:hypothetical protein [Herbiconiux moechotypicola]MCS5731149.1 hypothetical protein [Herbiconiux moechotypicola]